ncbi:MAG: SDR family NAD(P)-dependent oxidoreductase [Pseudomonadota bacterium]
MSVDVPGDSVSKVPRTALVTGGAGAIGFAIAEALGKDRRVAILDIGEGVEERAAALPDGIGLSCDLADGDALNAAYRKAADAIGPFGVVVHAAAIASVVPFLDTDRALFDASLNVNLTSGFDVFRLAAQDLVEAGLAGRLIGIASISGARAGFGRTAYGVSKAGLIHLVNQIALELGPYGITANIVAPGPVDTPMSREAHTAEQRADYQRTIPMGRYGEASEVTGAVAYLAGDEAAYVSGQTLFVDGGYMASGMGVSIAQSAAQIRGGGTKG